MTLVGHRIRNIRVQELLGKGGMGRVYLGFDEALQRRVALKVLRAARRVAPQNKARFLREARMLSALEHPNICRIYDFVEHEGLEILVLEYVEGKTLTRLAADGVDEATRFEIVTQIASVLEAAHAAGIVHRDLKPDNVMWAAGGQVKVLDFGLARIQDLPGEPSVEDSAEHLADDTGAGQDIGPALRLDDQSETVTDEVAAGPGFRDEPGPESFTRVGSIVGTVSYMSPEQARGKPLTTASDMYSFGVLCHQLFTGEDAYGGPASTLLRLRKVGDADTVPVVGIDRELSGLIERLESKVPDARPRATDVLRALRSIGERPRRRRRRMWAAAAALTLLGLGAKYTFDLQREQARTEAALERAERARTEAQRVTDFLVEVFRDADPHRDRGDEITAREILARGTRRIDDELAGEPRIQARLLATMGRVYNRLGLYDESARMLERSVALYRAQVGSLEDLARDEPVDLSDVAALAASVHELGAGYAFLDRYAEAETLLAESLNLERSLYGDLDPRVASNLEDLGRIALDRGDLDRAFALFSEAVSIRERAAGGEGGREGGGREGSRAALGESLLRLAELHVERGEAQQAEALYRRALDLLRAAAGEDHPVVPVALEGLAAVLMDQGRFDEAEPLVRTSLDLRRKVLGDEHPNLGVSLSYLGHVALGRGALADAEASLLHALRLLEPGLGPSHYNVGANRLALGQVYVALGRWDEAQETLERSLDVWRVNGLERGYNAVATREALADVALGRGDAERARRLYAESLELWRDGVGDDSSEAASAELGLARAHLALGDLLAADRVGAELDARLLRLATKMPESPEVSEMRVRAGLLAGRLADCRGDAERAAVRWREAAERARNLPGADVRLPYLALRAELALRLGEADPAAPWLDALRRGGWADPELWRLAGEA